MPENTAPRRAQEAAAALFWMLHLAHEVPRNTTGAGNRYALKIESVKYGLGTIAAGGAAAALLLAVRRQRLAERTQRHTEDDAEHRRFADLYTKAVEQIGHAEAAARLGGLYALERVAQDNPDQRQMIVNVLCAYLRMPFDPSPDEERVRAASFYEATCGDPDLTGALAHDEFPDNQWPQGGERGLTSSTMFRSIASTAPNARTSRASCTKSNGWHPTLS